MARVRTRNCNINRKKPPVAPPTLVKKQHNSTCPLRTTPANLCTISFPSSITTAPGLIATPCPPMTVTELPSPTASPVPAANDAASPRSSSPWPRRFQVPPHPPGTFFAIRPARIRAPAPSPAYLYELEKTRSLRLRVTVNTSALRPLYQQPVFYRDLPDFFGKKPYTFQEVKDVLENDPDFLDICRVLGLRGAEVAFLLVKGVSVSSEDGFSGLLDELWWAYEDGAVGGERRTRIQIVLGRGAVGGEGNVRVGNEGGEDEDGSGGQVEEGLSVEDEGSKVFSGVFSQVGRTAGGNLGMRKQVANVGSMSSMDGDVGSLAGGDANQETLAMRGFGGGGLWDRGGGSLGWEGRLDLEE